jgi:hypothetical protein
MSASTPDSSAGNGAGRVAANVLAVVVAVLALTAIAVGLFFAGVHSTQRDGDGYLASGQKRLTTPTHALVADKLDVETGPDWLFDKSRLGTLRVTASGTGAKPIFVGIARTYQVDAYLRGVARDKITDIEVDPFSVTYGRQPGAAQPATPGKQTFWVRDASGAGRQTLT